MSLFGYENVSSVTRTLPSPLELISTTAITLPAAASLTVKNATTTRPATTADTNPFAGSRLVATCALNYAKIQCFISASAQNFACHVIGWNQSSNGLWRPQPLATVGATSASVASQVIPGASPTNAYSWAAITATSGDRKIYAQNASAAYGGFIIVDLCGCELVEIDMTTEVASTTGYAMIGFL